MQTNRARRGVALIMIGLAIVTAYAYYAQRPHYQLKLFSSQIGWGYFILDGDRAVVYQPTIPGQTGNRGFVSEAQARRVGEQVIVKLEQGNQLPTLTQDELHRLGVATR